MPVVDAHAHVFAAVSGRYPRDVHELYPADLEWSAEDLVAEMDRHGVDHAVLVAVSGHDEYLAEVLRRYPGRFAGIGLERPEDRGVDAHRQRCTETGIDGVRLYALGPADAVAAEDLPVFPLLAEMAATGQKLWYYAAADQLRLLDLVLRALPDLTVVMNHMAFSPGQLSTDAHGRPHFNVPLPPSTLPAASALARFDGVHILFSGAYAFSDEPYPYSDLGETAERLLDAFGAERVLMASDFPWIVVEPGYGEILALVDRLLPGLSADERAAIRGGNAARLFGFADGKEASP